jgi:hemoglobin/transferrin/lactoferrin receptor protein
MFFALMRQCFVFISNSTIMKKTLYFLLLFMPILSFSQEAKDSLSKVINLDEVVISVNKVEEQKRNLSHQVDIVLKKNIERQNFQNTADILSNSGYLSVQKSQQGGGSPVIRGFEANRLLLQVDGVRMNNLIFRAGHLQNIITVDENILNRIEVLYGPSSTVYGSDALGGAINLYTKDPVLKGPVGNVLSGTGSVKYNSVNRGVKAHLDFNIGFKKWASFSSITCSEFGDVKMGSMENGKNSFFGSRPYYAQRINGIDTMMVNKDSLVQKFSGYKQIDILEKILFQQNSTIKHLVNIQYSTSTDIPRYDRLTDMSGGKLKYAEWYYGPQERLLASYNFYGRELMGNQNIHVGVHYQDVEESRHQRRFGRDELQHRTEHVNVINFNTDVDARLGNGQLRYGIEAEYDKLKSTAEAEDIVTGENNTLDTRYPSGKNSMFHSDFYATYTHNISDELIANAGLRLGFTSLLSSTTDTTYYRLAFKEISQKNFTYSGNVGIVYFPISNLKLFANMGSGYRVPNIDDLAKIFESAPGSVIVPNNNLKPEKSITTDLGFIVRVDDVFNIENTFYYTRIADAIITDGFTLDGNDSILYDGTISRVLANQNLGDAFIMGLSAKMGITPVDGMEIYATLNLTHGEVITDSANQPLDHIPPMYGIVGIKFEYKNLYADINVLYNGKKDIKDYYLNGEDNEQYAPEDGMPAWYTVNLNLSYNFTKYLSIQAGIENLLDVQYRVFASGINSPGRNYYGAIRVNF